MNKRILKLALITGVTLTLFGFGCFLVKPAHASEADESVKGFDVVLTDKNSGEIVNQHFDMFLDA